MEMLIAIAVGFVLLAILGYVEYRLNYKRDHATSVKKISVEDKK